ncbi:glycosyltransferase family 2 protein [Aeromonas enterica]
MRVCISIIVLNYNSSKYTINCIDSILKGSYQQYEIILVDNNSNADERGIIIDYLNVKNNDKILFIENDINFGFALGNIFGVSVAKGKYIFILNNDTLVDECALDILHSFMEDNPDVSLCIPSQYNKDGVYHPSFAYLPSVANQWFGNGLCRMLKPSEYMDRRKEYKAPFRIQMGSGASMFFRASDYFKIGGLDPNFFLYCEEEDICIRMRKEKMNIFFVPDAKIIHYGGGSTNRNIEVEIEFYRSLFYFFDKNYKYFSAKLLKFRFFIKELIKSCKKPTRLKLLFAMIIYSSLSHSLRHKQRGLKG